MSEYDQEKELFKTTNAIYTSPDEQTLEELIHIEVHPAIKEDLEDMPQNYIDNYQSSRS